MCFNKNIRGCLLGTREGSRILEQWCSEEIDEQMSWMYNVVNDKGCRKQNIIAFGNSNNEQNEKNLVPLFI